jgi:hypothetical protein
MAQEGLFVEHRLRPCTWDRNWGQCTLLACEVHRSTLEGEGGGGGTKGQGEGEGWGTCTVDQQGGRLRDCPLVLSGLLVITSVTPQP